MVWKSPLRQHSKGSFSEAVTTSSQTLSSPAEIQVREIASRIGISGDSEILATVCHKMRKEYVVEEWQLPALDSRQWEKMHAPIGLAVAVQFVASHRLREQEMAVKQREGSMNNDTKSSSENGQKQKSLNAKELDKSPPLSSSLREDAAEPTETRLVADSDETIRDQPSEKTTNDHGVETNNPPLASNDTKNKITDVIDTVERELETPKKKEEIVRESEATTAIPAADSNDDDNSDGDGGIVSMTTPAPSAKNDIELVDESKKTIPMPVESMMGATELEVEPVDALEQVSSTGHVKVKREQKASQGVVKSVESDNEMTKVKTEPVHDIEQDNSIEIAKVEEEQEASQVESKAIKSTESDSEKEEVETKPARNLEQNSSTSIEKGEPEPVQESVIDEEAPQVEVKPIESNSATTTKQAEQNGTQSVENDDGCEGDSRTASMDSFAALREITSSTSGSDSESEETTNIFSGIANSASFSEDEDDNGPDDTERAQPGSLLDPHQSAEDIALSSISDPDTSMMLFADNSADNSADDITVAVSNVSPEGREFASKRKKKVKKYNYEYDRVKICKLCQRKALKLFPT